MELQKILSRLESLEAASQVLAQEATRLKKDLAKHVHATPPARGSVLSAQERAAIKGRLLKNALKKK